MKSSTLAEDGRAYLETGLAGGSAAHVLDADLAATDACPQVARLEGLGAGRHELLVDLYRGQPEAVLVGEVVARAPGAIALDEGRGPEVLQAGAGAGQRLTAASWTRRRVLQQPPRGIVNDALRLHATATQVYCQ